MLVNGKIVTVDAAMPQAEAIAVRGDRIVAVGSTQEIEALVSYLPEYLWRHPLRLWRGWRRARRRRLS